MINLFFNRVFRAIKIDIDLFEEVEKDKKATFQAGTVVVLSSLAAGVGSIHLGATNFLIAPALSLLSWYVWAYIIFFVGVKLFGDNKPKVITVNSRTIGFSSAPGILRIFGVTPELMTVTFVGSAFDVSLYGGGGKICLLRQFMCLWSSCSVIVISSIFLIFNTCCLGI